MCGAGSREIGLRASEPVALLDHGAFHRGHCYPKAASGSSQGQTVSHRSHQSFFQVGRIGMHTDLPCTTYACCCFSQVALGLALTQWRQVVDVAEEIGEAAAALIGFTASTLSAIAIRATFRTRFITTCMTWKLRSAHARFNRSLMQVT
jgi:hypothetical protein